jgi:hypothetical protein
VPTLRIRKVPGLITVTAMSSVVMSADRVAALNGDVCKSCVTVGILTEPVQHLDHARRLALRFPTPHMDVVAVSGGQNLLLMM